MADSSLEIVISAKDETSRVLDQVRSKFTGFDQDVQRTGGRIFDGLGGSVERLAVSFTRTLDPALGASVSRFSTLGANIARTAGVAGGFATVLGTTVVAAAGVAGFALNQHINTLSRVSQEQAKTNALLAEMDFGGLAGRARGLDRQMTELQATFSKWQTVKNVWVGAWDEIGGAIDRALGKLPSDFVRRFGTDQAAINLAQQARAQAGAAITQLVPGEIAKVDTRSRILGFQAGGELAGLGAQEALARRDIAAFLAEMDRREQALSNELTARERLIMQEGEQRLAAAPPEARPALEAELRAQREALGRTTAFDQLRRQRSVGAEQIGLGLAAGEEDLSRVPRITGTEADAALAERQRQADLSRLDTQRQIAEVLGTITPEMNMQLILTEAKLLRDQAGLTLAEKAALDDRARLAILEQMSRVNPMMGLIAGFSEASSRSREWGTEMKDLARDVDRTMSRTFSDGLFNLFTGRKGEDLGKQFGESLLRSLTDKLGNQLSGAVSGLFASALQGFRGSGFNAAAGGFDLLSLLTGSATGGGGGAIISPTGAPAGTLIQTAQGLAQVTPSGGLQLVGGGGSGFGLDTAFGLLGQANQLYGQFNNGVSLTSQLGLTGGGYLQALGATPISSIVGSGLSTAVATTALGQSLGFYTASGGLTLGGGVGAELASAGVVGGSYGAGVASGAGVGAGGTGGSTVASAAGAVLAGVALGVTIYSGLYQQPTALNIAINTLSGVLAGAVIGSYIYPGVGTVIGAIAGGAAAGATTGLKAGAGKLSTSEKSRRIGAAASNNLINAIRGARSIEDLVAIMNTQWSPHGEVQILTTYQGVTYWAGDFDDPAGAAATAELMVIPEFLDQLVIQVGESGAPQRRADLENEFRAKRDEILGILSNIPFGILESDRAAGVSRRTYLPFQQIFGIPAGTQQLVGSSEFYRRDLGGEDETIDFLIDRIRERSIRRDVDLTRDDFMFR